IREKFTTIEFETVSEQPVLQQESDSEVEQSAEFTTLESVTATAFINDLDETPDQTEDPEENLPEQRDEVLEFNTSISDDIDVEYDEVVVTDDIDVDKDDA
ncbi:hypothetical protein ABG067_009087, partial [Albugo candida]